MRILEVQLQALAHGGEDQPDPGSIQAAFEVQERGLRIPEQIAVAGLDNIPMANFVSPALTTVLQDTKQAGELLVKTLLHLINNEPVQSQMLPAKLIIRRSCGAVCQPEGDPAR